MTTVAIKARLDRALEQQTYSSAPSRRETTGKYWNFEAFFWLKKDMQYINPEEVTATQ
jgi:hypothetical protein